VSEEQEKHEAPHTSEELAEALASAGQPPAPGVSAEELSALARAEEAKGDPALDEVEPADIEVQEKEEPFEKLAA
jgi:segregation and condensation protein B